MKVDFDENNGRSTEIDADTLWAESESTTRAREAQERRMDSSPLSRDTTTTPGSPSDRTSSGFDSGLDRRSQGDINQ